MPYPNAAFWKQAPFLRLLIPFIAGILVQWYFPPESKAWTILFLLSSGLFGIFFFLPVRLHFRFGFGAGLTGNLLFLAIGGLLTRANDIRLQPDWFEKIKVQLQAARGAEKNLPADSLLVSLEQAPVEKPGSRMAIATVRGIVCRGQTRNASGKIIVYFAKDSISSGLTAGTRLLIQKPLQAIRSSGNPGGFDYRSYCLLQQITHQVYLQQKDFKIPGGYDAGWKRSLLHQLETKILCALRRYIPGEKEKGLAEALLIGYKVDLDKSLVQSYTRTGVVHIIAISGLHLGLIYWLLVILTRPLKGKSYSRWIRPLIILFALWTFTLLAGAQPSILRSAVMFTCLLLGETAGRKVSVYNSLSASAFILLCYNPFWLADIGFQLSYAALLSILIFTKPIYHCYYTENKIVDFIWKLNAVTLAAQVLTVPLTFYHFHQFPNYFLLSNLVAVPLSSLIVLFEIVLCAVSFIPWLAILTGHCLQSLIWFMNAWVARIENLPFSLWDCIQIQVLQALLLYIFIAAFSYWMLKKKTKHLFVATICLIVFVSIRSVSFMIALRQQKIIVYSIPRKQAVDLINGREFRFFGDEALLTDTATINFQIKPARILFRAGSITATASDPVNSEYFVIGKTHVLNLKKTIIPAAMKSQSIDLLLISGTTAFSIAAVAKCFQIEKVVFDCSAIASKIKKDKALCDSLHISWYDVNEKGAFVMTLR